MEQRAQVGGMSGGIGPGAGPGGGPGGPAWNTGGEPGGCGWGVSVGLYLARRLREAGITDVFAVPGDFNQSLLEEMLKEPGLRMVNCCNELNAGYAADGYARSRGAAALVLTYAVGGFSAINAVAGAYAEEHPVIVISGAPRNAACTESALLHHSLETGQEAADRVRRCYAKVTALAQRLQNPARAAYDIDHAISLALDRRRPVYLEVACDLAQAETSRPHALRLEPARRSDPGAQAEALAHAAEVLNAARRPVLVAGARLRTAGAIKAFHALADRCGFGVACMPDAKGFFPELHAAFMGIYWGEVSTSECREVVEAADACLFAAPRFSDHSTAGFSMRLAAGSLVEAGPDYLRVQGQSYHGLVLREFLEALALRLQHNPGALEAYGRLAPPPSLPPVAPPSEDSLGCRVLMDRIQEVLGPRHVVVAESGDAWFQAMRLRLPEGAAFEIQMQYGSTGWALGACLGLALAEPGRRILALIGDGAFQMAAQELSTMLRFGCKGTIFVLNNATYVSEERLKEGPWNRIGCWDYAALPMVFQPEGNPGRGLLVRTELELIRVLDEIRRGGVPGLNVVEVMLNPEESSGTLQAWGRAVASADGI